MEAFSEIIEAKLLSKFLNDPKRILMTEAEQHEVIDRIDTIGRKLKERCS